MKAITKCFNYYFIVIALGANSALIFNAQALAEQTPDENAPASEKIQSDKGSPSPIPELKPDLPKLAEPIKSEKQHRQQLKGSIQHREVVRPNDGQLKGNLSGSQDKGSIKLKADQYSAGVSKAIESGLGIIGLKFAMYFGRTPIIYQVFPGTPAESAGIRARDTIIAVDGIPTFGLTKNEVYNMIVGRPGTEVTLSYTHNHSYQTRTLVRMDVNAIPDPRVRRDYLSM